MAGSGLLELKKTGLEGFELESGKSEWGGRFGSGRSRK